MKNLRTKLCAAFGALTLLGCKAPRTQAVDACSVVYMVQLLNMVGLKKVALVGGIGGAAWLADKTWNEGRCTEFLKKKVIGNSGINANAQPEAEVATDLMNTPEEATSVSSSASNIGGSAAITPIPYSSTGSNF